MNFLFLSTLFLLGTKFVSGCIPLGQQMSYRTSDSRCRQQAYGGSKVDCGWPGITARQCDAKGCCWDFQRDGPHCFYKSGITPAYPASSQPTSQPMPASLLPSGQEPRNEDTCPIPGSYSSNRVACGWNGIDERACRRKGCCYNRYNPGVYSCFYKKVGCARLVLDERDGSFKVETNDDARSGYQVWRLTVDTIEKDEWTPNHDELRRFVRRRRSFPSRNNKIDYCSEHSFELGLNETIDNIFGNMAQTGLVQNVDNNPFLNILGHSWNIGQILNRTINDYNNPVVEVLERVINGGTRVDSITAIIRTRHLRERSSRFRQADRNYMLNVLGARPSDEMGHLVAKTLGGESMRYNLAPQYAGLNRNQGRSSSNTGMESNAWFDVENEIRRFLNKAIRSNDLNVRVEWRVFNSYDGPLEGRPDIFTFFATFFDGLGRRVKQLIGIMINEDGGLALGAFDKK